MVPRAGLGGGAGHALAHRERREPALVQRDQDLERLLGVVELVFVEVDGCHAGHQALLGWRLGERGQAAQVLRGIGEIRLGDVDLALEGQSSDVVWLDHRHVLESRERSLAIPF